MVTYTWLQQGVSSLLLKQAHWYDDEEMTVTVKVSVQWHTIYYHVLVMSAVHIDYVDWSVCLSVS